MGWFNQMRGTDPSDPHRIPWCPNSRVPSRTTPAHTCRDEVAGVAPRHPARRRSADLLSRGFSVVPLGEPGHPQGVQVRKMEAWMPGPDSGTGSSDRPAAATPGMTCPSSPCHPGAVLIAVLGQDGRLGYLRPALPVDEEFVEACGRHGDPESRLRFADGCRQDSCEHWSGRHCSLVGRLISAGPGSTPEASDSSLPRCAIRADCRWFAQEGSRACAVCPIVVYRPSPHASHWDAAASTA